MSPQQIPFFTLFKEISHELIHITENGKTKTVTRIEAVLRQMTSRAMSGDPRVMREFIQHYRACEDAERVDDATAEPDEKETVIIQSVLNRMRRTADRNEAGAKQEADIEPSEEEE